MTAHPLDRPAWSALTGGLAHLARGDDCAWRIEPDHGPFAATTDFTPENIDALRFPPEAEGELWLVETARMPGLAEVSGVCTHPDHRGKGYAARLMRLVVRRMLAQGETPFLHAYAANEGAVQLYETLGFRTRRTVRLTVVTRG